MSASSLGSSFSANSVFRSIQNTGAKTVNARDLPGSADRAQRLIDSAVQVETGRRDSVQGYATGLGQAKASVQRLTSIIENLPADTTQKDRNSWNQELASAKNEITYANSQIAAYQAGIANDPSGEATLGFAGALLGLSTEQVHKIYNDRIAALESSNLSPDAAADSALAQSEAVADSSAGQLWGSDTSGLRAEIKVNGVVVGRVFNGGGVEMSDDNGAIGLQLGFGGPGEAGLDGPDLADRRIAQLSEAFKDAQVEVVKAPTAQTQAQWLASQASADTRVDRSA
jgi:hypothetical protein